MRYKQLMLWLGLALAWIGYWAPWIAPRAAALNLNAYDLAEWISRLPGVRDGSLRLGRLDFLLPLASLSLLTALAANARPAPPAWLRWPARLLALLGAFLLLPEYPFILTAHADPELRPALILGGLALLAVGALIVLDHVDLTGLKDLSGVNRAAYAGLVLVAISFTVRALVVVWPPLAGLFNAPPGLNWGPVVFGVGMGLEGIFGVKP